MRVDNPERWQQIKEVLGEALERPTSEREEFVRVRCGSDNGLWAQVLRLLAHDRDPEPTAEGVATARHDEWVGRRVGPYQIEWWLHSGGYGQVYVATRVDDVKRRVAIKFLPADTADDESFRRRFHAEMQFLALLNHPNIVTLLDAGTAPDNRPFYVMEYVDGLPIGRHCASGRLTVRQRLQLFLQVCEAVHYSHAHLLIHRDLKPGNILVTTDGRVKLLDFGIAKLMGPELSGQVEPVTVQNRHPMTPLYASPEQLRWEPLTTSSDVYSLGVVLYELLSHALPFRPQRDEDLKSIVSEREPPAPSESSGEAPAAEFQEPSTQGLRRRLRGELDNIVLKALRKEPSRRYASALDLAADIRRYLEGLPVEAHAGSVIYRARKFVVRHRIGVGATVMTVLALVVGFGAALYQWRRAEDQWARAELERGSAERRLAQVQTLARTLEGTLDTIKQTLSPAAAVYERVRRARRRLEDDPGNQRLEAELASSYQVLCETLEENGEIPRAAEMCRQALQYRKRLVERNPGDEHLKKALSAVERRLAALDKRVFGYAGTIAARTRGPDATMHLALGYRKLGDLLQASGELESALGAYRSSVELYEDVLEANPKVERLVPALTESYSRLASIARELRRPDVAEECEKRLRELR